MGKSYDKTFKAKAALEAIKETSTLQELARKYDVHPNQISQWKQHLLEGADEIFERANKKSREDREEVFSHEQETGQKNHAAVWFTGPVCETSVVGFPTGPSKISVSPCREKDFVPEPGLGERYHLHKASRRNGLSCRDYRPVFAESLKLEIVEYRGRGFLRGSPGRGDCGLRRTGNLQYGPGVPIYQ